MQCLHGQYNAEAAACNIVLILGKDLIVDQVLTVLL
jgi:hypothetical protein